MRQKAKGRRHEARLGIPSNAFILENSDGEVEISRIMARIERKLNRGLNIEHETSNMKH